ncbi:hypothetical protein KGO5_04323 [Sinorhizobium sp. KGO-5]|jgi:hypothetical protein|nr:hypothetical protein KGO5_04323 [Sinorhizobium sp. KGO-5]
MRNAHSGPDGANGWATIILTENQKKLAMDAHLEHNKNILRQVIWRINAFATRCLIS